MADYAQKRLYDNPTKGWPVLHPAIDEMFRRTMTELGYTVPTKKESDCSVATPAETSAAHGL